LHNRFENGCPCEEVIVALGCGEGKDSQSRFNVEVFSFHLTVAADFVTGVDGFADCIRFEKSPLDECT
jgi:hypothetical protein